MKKLAATAGLTVALAGIIGGYAVAENTHQPATSEAPMVVVPAANPVTPPATGTPTPTTVAPTTTAPAPVKTTTTAAPVKTTSQPAPVQSAQAAPAPAPVQTQTVKRYAVSAQPADTTGTTTGTPTPGSIPPPPVLPPLDPTNNQQATNIGVPTPQHDQAATPPAPPVLP